MARVIVVVSESTSRPFRVIKTEQVHTLKEMRKIGDEWVRQYISNCGYLYNPFYCFVLGETKAPKNIHTITLNF